ncbi:MAG: hypothetical protein FJX80_05755 [Bacteroidetes bacterium]|nr:hypothetical protein [Bacteroidota bacterium]
MAKNINSLMPDRAQSELSLADEYAKNAATAWEKGKEAYQFLKKQRDRLKNWKGIMSTAPVLALNAAFIPVCVAEYYFSKEIYRDINQEVPWSIAVGFISIGIVISEMIVYFVFKQKQKLKFYEMRNQDETNKDTPDDILERSVKKYAVQMFIIGTLLTFAIITLLYYFSVERASRELQAGMRNSNFGVQDLMPIGLYFFEIITGAFVWYTFRKTALWVQILFKEGKLKKQKEVCNDMIDNTKAKYQDAEEKGYNWFENASVSNQISEAFYMSREGNITDDDTFFQETKEVSLPLNVRIVRNGAPFVCSVDMLTEYKKRVGGGQNNSDTGEYKSSFTSFSDDAIVNIRLTAFDNETNQPVTKEIIRRLACTEEIHVLDWG